MASTANVTKDVKSVSNCVIELKVLKLRQSVVIKGVVTTFTLEG